MTDGKTLADLRRGESAVILELCGTGEIQRRLLELGMIRGTAVECVGISPLGDPSAFAVRGAVIALRREDAGRIRVGFGYGR